MNYAIIETGGKQYRAEEGAELDVELLGPEAANAGDAVKLDKVLLFSDGKDVKIGQPYLKGASVEAEVVRTFRERKVISFKYIRRENNTKTKIGHRQWKTTLRVKSLNA